MYAEKKQSRSRIASPSTAGDSLYAAAAEYLSFGWSVIPLAGKQPAIKTWKEYQSRYSTREELTKWFGTGDLAKTGVGIVTGKISGLVVVDCDTPEDSAYWRSHFLMSPLTVKTGRGGEHIYYKAPEGAEIRNRAGVFLRHIDVRGEGGYIVAPPSLHPSGKHYAWVTSPAGVIETLPKFDAEWIADRKPAVSAGFLSDSTNIRNVVSYIRRIHATAGEGGHNATYRAACKLRDAGLSEDEALALLIAWNETNASPPWTEAELAHKIRSAFNSTIS